MMRTEAPKDLAGRGVWNLARTTPELPVSRVSAQRDTFQEKAAAKRAPDISYHVVW